MKPALRNLILTAFETWRRKSPEIVNRSDEAYKFFIYDLKREIFSVVKSLGFRDKVIYSGVGTLHWARNPWVIIRDAKVSTGPRYGIYVAYLFSPDSRCLHLSICLGSENKRPNELKEKVASFTNILERPQGFSNGIADEIRSLSTPMGKIWAAGTIFSKRYSYPDLPDDRQLENDLRAALGSYQKYIETSSEEGFFTELLETSKPEEVKHIMRTLFWRSRDDIDKIVRIAVDEIKQDRYDGSKWSTLAISISRNFRKYDEAGKILEALVEREPENPAYLNNLGVNHSRRKQFDSALQYFARAYAIDSRHRGHKKASELPAWKNLVAISRTLAARKG